MNVLVDTPKSHARMSFILRVGALLAVLAQLGSTRISVTMDRYAKRMYSAPRTVPFHEEIVSSETKCAFLCKNVSTCKVAYYDAQLCSLHPGNPDWGGVTLFSGAQGHSFVQGMEFSSSCLLLYCKLTINSYCNLHTKTMGLM